MERTEYLLHPVLPDALAEVDQVAGRTGLPPLLVLLAPEILEVGADLPVFLHQLLVREVVHGLKDQ